METHPQNPKISKNNSKKKLIIATIAIIAIVLTAGLSYGFLVNPQSAPATQNTQNVENNQQVTPSNSWIAKGAYATYEGQATVMSLTISFNARMEITDLNATHLQIATTYDISTPFGNEGNTTTSWVSLEEMNFQPEGLDMNNTYVTQITMPNIGTRSCTVYEYKNQDISATYFIDNELKWPIKMTMNSPEVEGQSYNIDVNLVESNIPGL